METLQELRVICQKPRYREVGNWMVRKILRDAALPITWLLLHTRVSANQVTTLSMIAAVLGGGFLCWPSPVLFFTGALFFQLWYLLDHVDGQIARYRHRGTVNLSGVFYDFISHYLVNAVLLLGISFHVYFKTYSPLFLLSGFIAAFAHTLLNLLFDCRYKTFYQALVKSGDARFSISEEVRREASGEATKGKGDEPLWGLGRAYAFFYKLSEIHVMMNLLTLTALLFFHWRAAPFLFFLFYSFLLPSLSITKLYYLVSERKIDSEFERSFLKGT